MKITSDIPMEDLQVLAMTYVSLINCGDGATDMEVETIGVHPRWEQLKDHIEIPKKTRCDCCNKAIKYICIVEYKPLKAIAMVGRDCAQSINIISQSDFKHLPKQLAERAKLKKNIRNYRAANPTLVPMLDWAEKADWGFVQDVYSKLRKYGSLSEKQVAALVRSFEKTQEKANAPQVVKGDAPNGRMEVTGTLISTKTVETMYGMTNKMLVELPDLSRVYGTIPKSLNMYDMTKGSQVTFTGTFEQSRKDQSFGFFSRPSNASFTVPVAV
jgi:hypothetical protein